MVALGTATPLFSTTSEKQHYPRITNLEKLMDGVCGGHGMNMHHDRRRWRELEAAWIRESDVPWASGRQLSLREP